MCLAVQERLLEYETVPRKQRRCYRFMRVLVLEPGYCPYIAFFDSAEEAVRKIIQGEKNVALPFGNEVGYKQDFSFKWNANYSGVQRSLLVRMLVQVRRLAMRAVPVHRITCTLTKGKMILWHTQHGNKESWQCTVIGRRCSLQRFYICTLINGETPGRVYVFCELYQE